MLGLQRMCRVTRRDSVRNYELKHRVGVRENLNDSVDRKVLK